MAWPLLYCIHIRCRPLPLVYELVVGIFLFWEHEGVVTDVACLEIGEGDFPKRENYRLFFPNRSECVPVPVNRSVNSVSFCSHISNQSGFRWHSQHPA